jgi:predicted double-glycine peptidase
MHYRCLSEDEARQVYLANYSKGWKGLGSVTAMTLAEFGDWTKDGKVTKAAALDSKMCTDDPRMTSTRVTRQADQVPLDQNLMPGSHGGPAAADGNGPSARGPEDAEEPIGMRDANVQAPVPHLRQQTDCTCGPGALREVAEGNGLSVTEAQLAERSESGKQKGTDPEDLVQTARKLGLEVLFHENLDLAGLRAILDKRHPVIVSLQAWGDPADYKQLQSGHYSVVIGMDDESVYFADPAMAGDRKQYGYLSVAEFEKRWRNREYDGQTYQHLAIEAWWPTGNAEPSAKTAAEATTPKAPATEGASAAPASGNGTPSSTAAPVKGPTGAGAKPAVVPPAGATVTPAPKDFTTTLRQQIAPYYAKAPGGLDAAVQKAQAQLAVPGHNPRFSRWRPSALDKEIAGTKDTPLVGRQGMMDHRTGTVSLAPGAPQALLEHELTHAALGPNYLRQSDEEATTPLIPVERAKPEGLPFAANNARGLWLAPTAESRYAYAGTPNELDPRLAEAKRQYVKATGQQVDTPEAADKAWNAWLQKTQIAAPADGKIDPAKVTPENRDAAALKNIQGEDRQQLLRRMLELVQTPSPALAKTAAPIPGLPDRSNYGEPLTDLRAGNVYTLLRQLHDAARAKRHFDLRIGDPSGLHSWAMRKEMPKPGEKRLAVHQPLHDYSYKDFEGRIEKGYGEGTVSKAEEGQVLITKVTPDAVHFTQASARFPERFVLLKPRDPKSKNWLLVNTTPTVPVGAQHEKVHFKKIPAQQIENVLAKMQPGSTAEAKVDGASSLVQLLKDGIEVTSYRTAKNNGQPIVYSERMFGGRPSTPIPKALRGTVLKGELYGLRNPEGKKPEVLPAHELGGILNATVANALEKQRAGNIQLRNMLYDIPQLGKQPVQDLPRAERRKLLEQVLPHLPADYFHLSEAAETPESAQQLWDRIRSSKHPLTREGIVLHPATGVPQKGKLLEESDVHITGVYPGRGKYRGIGAGGFEYALTPGGKTVGRVGTGISDELRRELWREPDIYRGRVAKIRSQGQFASGAHRAPVLLAPHEDWTP